MVHLFYFVNMYFLLQIKLKLFAENSENLTGAQPRISTHS